ncbi:39S ribosomal protein L38, mitochondrial-like [Pomacea canaliculata]|nr:39S ribosomal protein L38, mitochondrial-like [Pomacea canaliculata]
MAVSANVACKVAKQALLQCRCILSVQPRRNRHKSIFRGKWPEEAKTFQQRLDELNAKDPELDRAINIGFPLGKNSGDRSNDAKKLQQWIKSKTSLESAARLRHLKLDLETVKEKWQNEKGPSHLRTIAEHYGIFDDLFGSAFFYNTNPLTVCYDYDEEFVTPVYYGNKIPPAEAAVHPFIDYKSDAETLWTLIMSCPDGNLQHNDKECLHWFVGNIPGSQIDKGETVCDYLQPFPVRGVGYLRYIFVLYKQNGKMDFSKFKKSDSMSLQERTFSTLEFYRQHQDNITPAGLAFFQSRWDSSVRSIFHDVLGIPEPSYEFIRPPNYHPQQKRYPHKQPFNLYLDRYRDVKDIQEEVLKEHLKKTDPFQPTVEPKYPNIYPHAGYIPSWLKTRIQNMRFGRHQWKHLKPEV